MKLVVESSKLEEHEILEISQKFSENHENVEIVVEHLNTQT